MYWMLFIQKQDRQLQNENVQIYQSKTLFRKCIFSVVCSCYWFNITFVFTTCIYVKMHVLIWFVYFFHLHCGTWEAEWLSSISKNNTCIMHSINQIRGLIVREDTSIISTNIQLLSKPTPSLWSNVKHYLTKSLCFSFL